MKAVIFGWKRNYLKTYLEDCEVIARNLALDGYDIYTGSGEGFMNAANSGSYNVDKKKSFGITVKCLDKTEEHNKNIINENFIITNTFAERKQKLIENYDIIICFPGGMGTLDEFTEIMNLLKTNELEKKTIILYGYKYWTSLISWFEFNNITFPNQYIDGIIDSVDEFNKLYQNKFKDNNKSIDTNANIETINDYKPLFNTKSIFNPFDNIDNLINIMFNNPDLLKDINLKDINLKEIDQKKDNKDEFDLNDIIKNNKSDEIIIEIIYEYSSDNDDVNNEDNDDVNNEDNDDVNNEDEKIIEPIDFITDSDTDSD